MLELIIVSILAGSLGKKAEAKGHAKIGYQLLLWLFWFVGEIGGAVFGAVISASGPRSEPNMGAIIFCALIGAIIGAVIAFAIVGSLADKNELGLRRSRSRRYDYEDYSDEDFDRLDRTNEEIGSAQDERIRRLMR